MDGFMQLMKIILILIVLVIAGVMYKIGEYCGRSQQQSQQKGYYQNAEYDEFYFVNEKTRELEHWSYKQNKMLHSWPLKEGKP